MIIHLNLLIRVTRADLAAVLLAAIKEPDLSVNIR